MSGNEKWLVEKLTKSTDSTLNATDQVRRYGMDMRERESGDYR